jgi:hypothetical protein
MASHVTSPRGLQSRPLGTPLASASRKLACRGRAALHIPAQRTSPLGTPSLGRAALLPCPRDCVPLEPCREVRAAPDTPAITASCLAATKLHKK